VNSPSRKLAVCFIEPAREAMGNAETGNAAKEKKSK
jgi:hypothetical protein